MDVSHFENIEAMEAILKGGSSLAGNKSLILKPWTRGLKFDRKVMCKVPI